MTAYPQGCSVPDVLDFVPPKGCLAEFWQGASGNAFLRMTLAPGSILDVHLDVTTTNVITPPSSAIVTGGLGSPYYLPLDGTTSHQILALGLPSTF